MQRLSFKVWYEMSKKGRCSGSIKKNCTLDGVNTEL